MEVALARDDAGLAQGGGIGNKEVNRFETYFRDRINKIGDERLGGRERNQSDPQVSGRRVNGSTVYFTGRGNSEGVNLRIGKIKRSTLAMLTKTSI